jgi:hypothetical protein
MAAAHRHRNRSASHHFAIGESRLGAESANATWCASWMSKVTVADLFCLSPTNYTRILLANAKPMVNSARPA